MNPDDDALRGDIPDAETAWRALPLPGADVALCEAPPLPMPADSLFAELLADVPWRQDHVRLFGRVVAQPRLTAWYGDAGARYRYSGLSLDPMAWTPRLAALRACVEQVAGARFDSCLLNLYRDGRDAIGWHADDERELGPAPVIAALSLGATRVMAFRPKAPAHRRVVADPREGGSPEPRERATPDPRDRVRVALPPGSLLVMRGLTQARWQHAIARTARPCGPRLSLTFRRVAAG